MNSVEKKTGGKLGSKLATAVISVMVVGFLMVLAIVGYSIYHSREESEIAAERLQQEHSASQVLLIQSTVSNIADQLSMNPIFASVLGEGSGSFGDLLTSKREIHNILSSCAHLYEGIEEVLIFSEDGICFSSREKRGDFLPEENPWFTDYLGSNKSAGFTEPHESAPAQDGSRSEVISYVCEYFTGSGSGKRAFIIINIRTDVFDRITGYRPALENGCVNAYPIYDWNFSDIWRFIYENNIRYNKIYDWMWKKGMSINEIRVSSLIHEKSFKAICELPEFEPKTYNRLCKRIKGIQTANIYGKDSRVMKCRKLPDAYETWREYRDFLMATYPDPDKLPIFEKRFSRQLENEYVARQQCRQLVLND